jgi:hypothetical protein
VSGIATVFIPFGSDWPLWARVIAAVTVGVLWLAAQRRR